MQYKRRIAIAVAVVAVSAALPAASLASKPVIRDHESFVEGPTPGEWCGAVDGTWSTTGALMFRQDASGAFHATARSTTLFTALATGKSIELDGAGVDMGVGVDNGDGTITYTEHTAGLAITFRIPNGPLLTSTDGKPLIGAGERDFAATFDIASGDLVSFQASWHGPHPGDDGVDVCTPTIAYLVS
jgi:hypothetical protein